MTAWDRAARRLAAKLISELTWEEVLAPEAEGAAHVLRLASGAEWRFRATRRIWDNLDIDPESLTATTGDPDPLRLVVEARTELGMTPATEAMFLRELSNTLAADLAIARRWGGLRSEDLIALPPDRLQAALEGHPKAVASKGRLGWGAADHADYAPESTPDVTPCWLAVDPDLCRTGSGADADVDTVLEATLGARDHARLRAAAAEAGVAGHVLVPVHPWQLDAHIRQAFVAEIERGQVVPLGAFGPPMQPTASLRTLSAPGAAYDLKLALGLLNTSAWRGMPGKYIRHGGAISDWLAGLVAADPVLDGTVTVLREVRGVWVEHPILARCPDAPYRHHEMLGAIWRESAGARLPGTRPVMAAALFHEGADGVPLALAHARAAGMTIDAWLAELFRVTVVPLWHMLCRYGTGFIAHGQNVTVVLDGDRPVGMALKDFQGDLDLVDRQFPEMGGLDPRIRALLPRKPPPVIVHDIQTAHFVTVLRFLSAALARAGAIGEPAFYALLRDALLAHRRAHPELEERFGLFDLFAPAMPKVCINRVRLAQGYEDSAARPLPARGQDLVNPLHAGAETPVVGAHAGGMRTPDPAGAN